MILDAHLQDAWATLSHLPLARGTVAGHSGSARLQEADDDTHTAVLRLQGRDPQGVPATATVTARLEAFGEKTRLHFAIDPQPDNVQAFKADARGGAPQAPAPQPAGARMKPAPFEYVAVKNIREGIRALREQGAVVIAGGQSLMPELNRREREPRLLVDINPIANLGVLRRTNGSLHIGATVRQAALERSPLVAEHWPLLKQAVRFVGHPGTRSRGTVCGSVAHRDPRAELPLALQALDARFITSRRMLTAFELEDGEFLTGIVVPPLPEQARTAFHEYAPTAGSYADAAVAVVLAPGHAALAVQGHGRQPEAEAALGAGATAAQAADLAARAVEDPHTKALTQELTRRALNEAGRE